MIEIDAYSSLTCLLEGALGGEGPLEKMVPEAPRALKSLMLERLHAHLPFALRVDGRVGCDRSLSRPLS